MVRKLSGAVDIKGYGDEVNIILSDEADFSNVEAELVKKLEDSDQFLAGVAVVLDLGDRVISGDECALLKKVLVDRFGLGISAVQSQSAQTREAFEKIGLTVREPEQRERKTRSKTKTPASSENDSILIIQTLRSGQNLWHPGNVVIVGDVNPGAEIVATGDIVVMGSLRGVAHAGAEGDISARIIALNLHPIQLRIAGYIGRSPDLNLQMNNVPEEARVEDGNIVIRKLK